MTAAKRTAPRVLALLTGLIALTVGAPAGAERVTPSGYPVPRYVTLKFDRVNARAGPGDDHRLLWMYQVKGLPVQVVAETVEWRRICDPDGKLAWVHRRVTDGRRAVINLQPRAQPLFGKPKAAGGATAYLNVRAMAQLEKCEKGWCRVKAPGARGWVREDALWGTSEKRQCR